MLEGFPRLIRGLDGLAISSSDRLEYGVLGGAGTIAYAQSLSPL